MKLSALILATFIPNSSLAKLQQKEPRDVPKQPFSVSAQGEGIFSGSIYSHQGTSSFDSISIKKNADVAGDLSTKKLVTEVIECSNAKFTQSATVSGTLNVTSGLTTKGALHTASIVSSGVAEVKSLDVADLVSAKRATVAQDVAIGGKVSSAVGFYSKDGTMATKDLETEQLKVKGEIEANDAEFRGEVALQKKLTAKDIETGQISISNKLEVGKTAQSHFEGDVTCHGQARFSKKISVQQLELFKFNDNPLPTIDATKGVILADMIKVTKNTTTGAIVANDAQLKTVDVSGVATINTLHSNSFDTNAIDADKLVVNSTQTKSLSAETITAANAALKEELSAKSIKVDSIVVADVQSTSQINTPSLTVTENLSVNGNINGTSINIGDLYIGMESRADTKNPRARAPNSVPVSRFGCLEVSPEAGIAIGCSLSVSGNVTIGELLAVKSIHATNMRSDLIVTESADAGDLRSRSINVTDGMVISSGGFSSLGDVSITNVKATGVVTAKEVQVDSMKASNTSVDSLVTKSLVVTSDSTFKDEAYFHGKVVYHNAVNFTSDVYADKVNADKVYIADALEVGGGVFAKRMYSQDISATGFITAPSIIAKGDVDVTGSIKSLEVKADKLRTSQVEVSNDLQCTTAHVTGGLDAGSISSHRVAVKTELIVGDSNILEVIRQLEARIAVLEKANT